MHKPIQNLVLDEKEDVIGVINLVKKLKTYKHIIGLAECYSCFTFAAAQADQEAKKIRFFDKLILDSTFVSLQCMNDRTCADPGLSRDNRHGGNSPCCKAILQNPLVRLPVRALRSLLIPDVSIKDSVSRIKQAQILFVHGKQDLLVPLHDFYKECWNICSAQKLLLITPFEHVSSRTDWGIYQWVCNNFIQAQSCRECLDKISLG